MLKVQRGKWTCVEVMVKMNAVGESNGEMALWIDGKAVSRLGKGFPKGRWEFDKFNPGQGGEGVRWSDMKRGPENFEVPEGGLPFEGFRWRTTKELDLNYLWVYLYITKAPNGIAAGSGSMTSWSQPITSARSRWQWRDNARGLLGREKQPLERFRLKRGPAGFRGRRWR